MRVFLVSYDGEEHLKTSMDKSIVGCKAGSKGREKAKFMKLQKGNLIVIRDSSDRDKLNLISHCIVKNVPFDANIKNDLENIYIWDDEIKEQKIIYPLRVKVDFTNVPILKNLKAFTKDDFFNIGIKNREGNLMGAAGLGKFFTSNFLQDGDVDLFLEALGRVDVGFVAKIGRKQDGSRKP